MIFDILKHASTERERVTFLLLDPNICRISRAQNST